MFHFCFRRWSRKGYSAFASMHKVVKIGVLSVSLSLITLGGQQALAQADSIKKETAMGLDEIVVVANRSDLLPHMIRVVSALSEVEIKQSPAQNLNDLLRYLPSADVRQRGPAGVQADIAIRGASFDQTQVLLNGVNFTDPQTGHYSLNLPLDLEMVSKLEILQGLSAPGAIGGALNVSTQSERGTSAEVILSGGQYGFLNAGAKLNIGTPTLQSFVAVSHQRGDGYTTNTDFGTTNAFSFLKYSRRKLGSIEAQLGYQHKNYGANGFYSFKYPNQLEHIQVFLGSVRWLKQLKYADVWALAYHRQHFDRFELFRTDPADWYKGHNYHRTLTSGAEAGSAIRSSLGVTTLAAELRNEQIYSNVLGEPMDAPKPVPFEEGKEYTFFSGRNNLRALLSHNIDLQYLSVTGGISMHYSSKFDTRYCYAFDVRVPLNNHALVYVAANQSLRLPTFTDLYYTGETHQANPDLKPEEATIYEGGMRYLRGSVAAGASVFYRQGRNIIDWVYNEGKDKTKAMNYGKLNTVGAELMWRWMPRFAGNSGFFKHVGVAYTFVKPNMKSDEASASYALDQLRHKVNADVNHSLGFKKLTAQWQLSMLDRMGSFVNPVGATERYETVLLLNLRVMWTEKSYNLFVEAINLLGTTYYDYGGIEQPKQWITAGVRVTFK